MKTDQYAIVRLQSDPTGVYIALSYPGLETNGTIIIAPLVAENMIAIVDTLHPVVETPFGRKVIAVERLAAVLPDMVESSDHTLIAYDYLIHRALSRLFYGN